MLKGQVENVYYNSKLCRLHIIVYAYGVCNVFMCIVFSQKPCLGGAAFDLHATELALIIYY